MEHTGSDKQFTEAAHTGRLSADLGNNFTTRTPAFSMEPTGLFSDSLDYWKANQASLYSHEAGPMGSDVRSKDRARHRLTYHRAQQELSTVPDTDLWSRVGLCVHHKAIGYLKGDTIKDIHSARDGEAVSEELSKWPDGSERA